MEISEKIILALDVSTYDEAAVIIEKFKDRVNIFKVGSELFTSTGPKIIEKLNSEGKQVFLDLKFHDIPNTVSKAALSAAELGVFMFNVHTMGGHEMMKHTVGSIVKRSLKTGLPRPIILGRDYPDQY